jgi:hypothetical protein
VERANGIFLDGVKIFVSHDNGSTNKDNHPKVNECFKWRETKSCPKGNRCQYAHMIHNGAVSRDMRFVVEEARTSVTTTDGRIVKIESERSCNMTAVSVASSLSVASQHTFAHNSINNEEGGRKSGEKSRAMRPLNATRTPIK